MQDPKNNKNRNQLQKSCFKKYVYFFSVCCLFSLGRGYGRSVFSEGAALVRAEICSFIQVRFNELSEKNHSFKIHLITVLLFLDGKF